MHYFLRYFMLPLCCFGLFHNISAQSSSDILHELKKLQNPTRVLYLAAHPDDENTRMISYLVNEVGAHTAYLSLTRGDGGQNLIGTELSAKLGVLRTQELMQARKIDGGTQFFSRAVDFGYSKNAKETLEKWGEDEVLSDVVWVIRKFRPDVIITRFPPDERGRHGHHTASALLGIKAFDMAGDKNAFPDQLQYTEPWQPKRIYWNTSSWWVQGLDTTAADNPNYVVVDIGGFNPVIGRSNNELASLSRTQHKSQGFGVSIARGSEIEYLEYLAGEKARGDIFDGIHQSWERYGFKAGKKDLDKIIANFDPAAPHKSVTALLSLRSQAGKINDQQQRKYFKKQLDDIILMSLGWHGELLSPSEFVQQGDELELRLEALNRSPADVKLEGLNIAGQQVNLPGEILKNETYEHSFTISVEDDISQSYWLQQDYENLFDVQDQQLIGAPENDPAITGTLKLSVNGSPVEVQVPAVYKFSDRVEGEIVRPVFITPQVVVSTGKSNMIFVQGQRQELELQFRFFGENEISVKVEAPGWEVEPSEFSIGPRANTDFAVKTISVSPTERSQNQKLSIVLQGEGSLQSLAEIDYSHIDKRLVFEDAGIPLINLDLEIEGKRIGYIPGAGDKVAAAITQMGYEVDILNEEKIRNQDLSQYQAIVAGIRAYNTEDWLPGMKPQLMEYVRNGGNYIVQYNTASRDLLSLNIGPYPFEITRSRVTEEDAMVNFLSPGHRVLTTPNKISEADFKDWVQERGLYFAGNYAPEYVAPLGWQDEGEDLQEGALIVGDYGKGAFMYTGISFFRELPAGVPGAYRLLANLLSYKTMGDDEQ